MEITYRRRGPISRLERLLTRFTLSQSGPPPSAVRVDLAFAEPVQLAMVHPRSDGRHP